MLRARELTTMIDAEPVMPRSVGTLVRRKMLHLLARTRQLWRVNFTVRTEMAGQPLQVPVLFGQGPQNLAFLEPGLFGAFERLLKLRSGTFVDVGVNLGQTLLKVKVLDRDRQYVGFETNPRCCHYVEELIKVNRFARCTIVPAGLADRNGLLTLYLRPNVSLDPMATIIADFAEAGAPARRQAAAVFRGDDVAESVDAGEVAIIKIDTEGAELEVLRGLADTIGRHRPFIVCEVLPVGDPGSTVGRLRLARQDDVQKLLQTWRYDVFRLHPDVRLQKIDDIGLHDDLALSNYLFAPSEQRAAVERSFVVAG
jgi:FkbM family methyltransferase